MGGSAGLNGHEGVVDFPERPRTASTLPVIILRLAVIVALPVGFWLYFYVGGDGEAPDTFSLGSWALMLVPPTVVATSLVLGFWLRVPHPSRRQLYLSRASASIVVVGFFLLCSFSLIYFLGELFDYAI